MEDVIILILAFVWLMYSLYKGLSKKKQAEKTSPQPAKQPEGEKKGKDFETVFREILGEEEVTTETATEPETAAHKPEAFQMEAEEKMPDEMEKHTGMTGVGDDFEFSAEGEIETIEDQVEKQKKHKEKNLEVIELWDEEDEQETLYFDPRTAVIHFEIMKRKY